MNNFRSNLFRFTVFIGWSASVVALYQPGCGTPWMVLAANRPTELAEA